MEIHAPDHPITGWRDTVRHLAIITAGILIALTLEGVVSWLDHRMLVREAVANLTEEIRNNKKHLDGMFARFNAEREQLQRADEIAVQLLQQKAPAPGEMNLEAPGVELKNAAVTTGQITGAFGYMSYDTVSRYANVYDYQAQFMRLQEREVQNFEAILAFIPRLYGSSPPSPAALEEWRGRLSMAGAGIYLREQMGRQLQKRYEELLAEK